MALLNSINGSLASSRGSRRLNEDTLAFPLSPAQEKMWLASQDCPGNPVYNASFRWSLDGPLDPTILQQAFNEIVARHEILRASFDRLNGTVSQLIAPSLRLLIPVTDLRSLAGSALELEVERICATEAARNFNLEKGPLIRVGLLRLGESRYVLMLTLHHIICDGWSISVIMRELKELYSAIARGGEASLPTLSIQFADYIVWKNDDAQRVFDRELGYWAGTLQGYRPSRLRPDLAEPSQPTVKSRIVSRVLRRGVTDVLKAFCDQRSGTMFSTTLAACVVLLNRHTRETDIAIETPLAARDRTEIEDLIGLFVNRIVLRIDASGDPTFSDLVARVRDVVWGALEHQEVPFEKIVEAISAEETVKREPYCPINFVCQRAFGGSVGSEFDFMGIRVSPIPSKSPGTLHDLNFFIVERDDGWRLSLEYKTDLYSAALGDLLLEQFCDLLEAIAEDPNLRLSQYRLPSGTVSKLFDLTRPLSPEPAVSTDAPSDPEPIQHFQMPASVSQLRFWRLSQIRPDSPVFNMPATVQITGPLSADILERSIQAVIDRQEILRTTFREVDGQLTQLISSRFEFALPILDLRDLAEEQRDSELENMLLKEAHEVFDLEHEPALRVRLFRLGAEKHVLTVILHHVVSDGWSQGIFQRELWQAYEALAEGRQPLHADLPIQYADFAVWQKEWLPSDEAKQHLEYWMKSLAGPLPVLDFPTDFSPGQRSIVRGAVEGMQLPQELIGQLRKLSQSEHATMFMLMLAAFAMLLERYTTQHDLTIGSPSANRNSQTDSLIGPFSGPIALRMDLSGNPTFRDILKQVSQVTMDALDHSNFPFEILMDKLKVRSILGRNPLFQFYFTYQSAFLQPHEMSDLLVVPKPAASVGNPFEIQLAIIERNDGVWANVEYDLGLFEAESIRAVLSYLRFLLDEIAAEPNRRLSDFNPPQLARRQTQSAAMELSHEFVAPRGPVEAKIVAMWKELFESPSVGIRDDFFDLGGHSLLAARLFSMIEKEFGVRLDLSKLLVARTVEQLAHFILQTDEDQQSSLIPLRASGTKMPFFCVHGGGGHVLSYQDLAEALPEDLPVYGLSAPDLDGAKKSMTVEELAAFYNREIRRIQPNGPYRLCGYSFGGFVAIEMASQLMVEGEEVPVITILDTANSSHYRNLPFPDWLKFWTTRLIDRAKRYYRRLADRRVDVALSSALYFVRKNVHLRFWTITRNVFRAANRPLPKQMRDNVTMFKAEARSYRPRSIPGRVILFRVDDRDPEYSHNKSLGWELVASRGVSVHYVPGDHLSFMREPHVREVARQLEQYLG